MADFEDDFRRIHDRKPNKTDFWDRLYEDSPLLRALKNTPRTLESPEANLAARGQVLPEELIPPAAVDHGPIEFPLVPEEIKNFKNEPRFEQLIIKKEKNYLPPLGEEVDKSFKPKAATILSGDALGIEGISGGTVEGAKVSTDGNKTTITGGTFTRLKFE